MGRGRRLKQGDTNERWQQSILSCNQLLFRRFMIMKLLNIAFLILLAGCQSTFKTFNKEVPDKYVEVIASNSDTDLEASLKASGQDYVCKEFYYAHNSPKNRRACFIKMPEDNQIERLKIKMEGVPEAVLLDTGKNILIVGNVFLEFLFTGYVPLN